MKNTNNLQLLKRTPNSSERPTLKELQMLDLKINKNVKYELTKAGLEAKLEDEKKLQRFVKPVKIRKILPKDMTMEQYREAMDRVN
jgi:hypothetical protein